MKNKIYILGGAGAFASVYCHHNFLVQFSQSFKIKKDADYPEIIHFSSNSLSINNSGLIKKSNIKKIKLYLDKIIKQANHKYHNYLLVPCNSIQPIVKDHLIDKKSNLVFINMLESIKPISFKNEHTVIFSSRYSRQHQLFDQLTNFKTIYPDPKNNKIIDKIINASIAGRFSYKKELTDLINNYNQTHNVLLACSELSPYNLKMNNTFDTIDLANQMLIKKLLIK